MYSGIATSLRSDGQLVTQGNKTIKDIDFKSSWSSSAFDTLNESLETNIAGIDTLIEQFNLFSEVLVLVDEYIRIVEEIERLQALLANIVGDDEEAQAARAALEAQIATLMAQKKALRARIEAKLASISGVSLESFTVSYTGDGDFNYVVNVDALLSVAGQNSKNLSITSSLYALYDEVDENGNVIEGSGKEYVNKQLDSVTNNYSGREAAVNSMLMALSLAADKGYKIAYVNAGQNMGSVPYNTNEQLQDGMDCCSYVSWAVNKGSADPFHWEGVGGFNNIGDEISFSEAQPGDIFVKYDDEADHVGMIIENNVETGELVVSDARGGEAGVVIRTVSYSEFENNNVHARSLEDYYTGVKSNA